MAEESPARAGHLRQSAAVDPNVAHNARVWNYWLGGKEHYLADRVAGDRVAAMFPGIVEVALADRVFLGRAVRYLAGEAGIRQFLDIGTGLPTVDNTHEVAQRTAPRSRVVYVDNDPLVLAHARALLTSTPAGAADYIDADLREPDTILRTAAKTLDFTRPTALMLLGVVNFIPDTDEALRVVRRLLDALPSGSYMAITHPTLELGGEANAAAMRFWNENATPAITARSSKEIAAFFEGLEMLEPGLVSCSRWRPEAIPFGEPREVPHFGAVARKP
jgi:O-methyltransferase involved in polyketide biosynthesis